MLRDPVVGTHGAVHPCRTAQRSSDGGPGRGHPPQRGFSGAGFRTALHGKPRARPGPGQAVVEVSRDDRFHALYVLALCLGLRRGELLGLRWQDVDLVAGRLEVVHTLQRVDGRLLLVPPKTEGSAQTVPLPDLCITSLREHRERQLAERPAAGANWQDHGLVFPSRRGTPLEPTNLRRSWHPLRSAAGLDGMRFHDLRHTSVTLLLNLDVPPQVVREIVGHSDIGVTTTIYAHTSFDDKRRALGRLGDALG